MIKEREKYEKNEKLRKQNRIKKIKFLNRDEGNLVKTKTWTLLFANITNVLRDLVQLRIIVIKNILLYLVLYLA